MGQGCHIAKSLKNVNKFSGLSPICQFQISCVPLIAALVSRVPPNSRHGHARMTEINRP